MSEWDGRPDNPEQFGAHTIRHKDSGDEWAALWHVSHWIDASGDFSAEHAANYYDYGGPCLTPAEVEALTTERDMWRQENLKKQIACEQMGARIVTLEAREAAARREGIEAAVAVVSKRAASRHSTVSHCHSDRSKKHMQIRADEAGQLVADIRALLKESEG